MYSELPIEHFDNISATFNIVLLLTFLAAFLNLYLFLASKEHQPHLFLKTIPVLIQVALLVLGYSARLQRPSGKFCSGDYYLKHDDIDEVAPLYSTGKYLFYLVYGVIGTFLVISYRTRTYQTGKAYKKSH